jgi:arsenate reductase (glutaredoxin)
MHLYGIPNCNTVKKARDFLAAHHVNYTFHDFKKEGVTNVLLTSWTSQMPWEKLVNKAGMTWRNLTDTEKAAVIDAKSAIELMQHKTSVIKRPVLINNDKIIAIGFNEATYQTALAE